MQIRDHERGGQAEFQIFWVGIAFGVLSSFTASIIYEFARDWETRHDESKRPPLIIP